MTNPSIQGGRGLCLVVEDQALIGLALEASLEEAGFAVAGPFGRARDACVWLDQHTPDIALLDLLLIDGPCLEIATVLRDRGVPFAIYSGVHRPGDLPPELADAPWLDKPVTREELAAVLAALLQTNQENKKATAEVGDR